MVGDRESIGDGESAGKQEAVAVVDREAVAVVDQEAIVQFPSMRIVADQQKLQYKFYVDSYDKTKNQI
jgi:hypothetical protein